MPVTHGVVDAALWIIVSFQALLAISLLQQLSELRRVAGGLPSAVPMEELPTGTLAPRFRATDIRSGAIVPVDLFDSGGVLLFLTPGCSTCKKLVAHVAKRRGNLTAPLMVVCQGTAAGCRDLVARHNDIEWVVEDSNIARRFHVNGAPTMVLLGEGRRIVRYASPRSADDFVKIVASETPFVPMIRLGTESSTAS